MERYSRFLGRKNQYCENDYTTKCNLQIQCGPYQITNGVFHRTRTKVLTASDMWKDNRTFHYVRKGVISKGTQGHCIGEIRTTALYILSSLNMFPHRILSLSCYASFKFKFVYSLCHSFILSKVCVKHNYVCYERENQPCFHGTYIVLGSYSPRVSNLSGVHNCCD